MKNLILTFSVILSVFTFSAHATTPMAEILVDADAPYVQTLVDLYAAEAAKPSSPISKNLLALKADPDNDGYYFENKITELDIVRLDSGGGHGTYEINYLIFIRAGYKSNTFTVGYLKAQVIGSMIGDPTLIKIIEPAKVTIE